MSRCTLKVRYLTRRSAQRARHLLRGQHVRPYWCRQHLAWHLGHLPQAVLLGIKVADEVYRRGRWAA